MQILFMYVAIRYYTPIKLDLFLAAFFSFTLYAVHLFYIFVPCNALHREVGTGLRNVLSLSIRCILFFFFRN